MGALKLVKPTLDYKDEIWNFRLEHGLTASKIPGANGLEVCASCEEWLKKIEQLNEIPASNYLALREADSKVVGIVEMRHVLNDYLYTFGGNIGYSIKPSERKKGYAKELLRLALCECDDLGINKVLVTCSKQNIASAKTIIANGGILEDEVDRGDKIIQRYWINNLNKKSY